MSDGYSFPRVVEENNPMAVTTLFVFTALMVFVLMVYSVK